MAAAEAAWLVLEAADRVSMAGLSCYRDLLIRAHIQLGGLIVLVWDNLRAHQQRAVKTTSASGSMPSALRSPAGQPGRAGSIGRPRRWG